MSAKQKADWRTELESWRKFRGHLDLVPAIDACFAHIEEQAAELVRLRHADSILRRNGLLEEVAHRAWHLLDDGGEGDDNLWVGTQRQADALSAALDALEADGWTHGEDER